MLRPTSVGASNFGAVTNVSDPVLWSIANLAASTQPMMSYLNGLMLADEGTHGDSPFELADGTINVRKDGMVEQNIDAPAIIDEFVALYAQTRPDRLVAASDCQIVTIANDDVEALISADASTRFGVIRLLSERTSKAICRA